jgi:hypothetical protein
MPDVLARRAKVIADEALLRAVHGGGGGGGGITQLTGDVTAGPGSGAVAAIVARANGATIPAAGGLTPGNVLQVTGASALGYAPVNLASAASVTGLLPVANIAPAGTNGFILTTTGGVAVWAANGGGANLTPRVTVNHGNSPFTALPGYRHIVDESGGAVTINLPLGSPAGTDIAIKILTGPTTNGLTVNAPSGGTVEQSLEEAGSGGVYASSATFTSAQDIGTSFTWECDGSNNWEAV